MAQAPPPPPPYYPPPSRPLAGQSPGLIVAVVFLVVFMFAFMAFFLTGFGIGGTAFPSMFFAPFCFFVIFVLIMVVWAFYSGTMRQRIPPPPPIQQPMVPAGQTGPIALNCPNCGAPPQNVDRFGVATCTYCNTRFLVR